VAKSVCMVRLRDISLAEFNITIPRTKLLGLEYFQMWLVVV